MHDLLVHAASSRVGGTGTHWQVPVLEFTPDADDFDALRLVGIDEKIVFHDLGPLTLRIRQAHVK
jgi:hypothetical protein